MHDRDSIYGKQFRTRVNSLAIEEVISVPRSSWQNPYFERVIGCAGLEENSPVRQIATAM
jgi:hypothetical protein